LAAGVLTGYAAGRRGRGGRTHESWRFPDRCYEGHTQRGEAWFRVEEEARRIEWGSPDSAYRGRLEVSPDGDGSRLTLFLATARGGAPDSEVMGTLDAIRRLVEAEE
jgi:hypothetical protein